MRANSFGAVVLLVMTLGACGDSGPELSAEAAAGRGVAETRGCLACHGDNGQGGVGPAWKGLAGEQLILEDGSTVVADAEYLRRSIVDPSAQIVEGFTVNMPSTQVTDFELDQLIAYIQELK